MWREGQLYISISVERQGLIHGNLQLELAHSHVVIYQHFVLWPSHLVIVTQSPVISSGGTKTPAPFPPQNN